MDERRRKTGVNLDVWLQLWWTLVHLRACDVTAAAAADDDGDDAADSARCPRASAAAASLLVHSHARWAAACQLQLTAEEEEDVKNGSDQLKRNIRQEQQRGRSR